MEATAKSNSRQRVDRALWFYTLLIFGFTVSAWVFYIANGRSRLRRPLFELQDRFADLTTYASKISHLNQGAGPLAQGYPVYNYPAPAAYVYAFFLRGFPHHPMRAYIMLLAAALCFGAFLVWKACRGSSTWPLMAATLTTGILGFPLIFAIDRGNLEGVAALFLGVGLVLFTTSRHYGSAIFIGLAASIKPFPGLFLLLLLRRKLYRQVAAGVIIALASVLAALSALGPTTLAAYKNLQPGVKIYFDNYIMKVAEPQEGRFEHSLTDFVKAAVNGIASREAYTKHGKDVAPAFLPQNVLDRTPAGPAPRKSTPDQLKHMYAVLSISVFLTAVGLVYVLLGVYRLPTLNQTILIGTAIALFPPVAAEYTLIHLYVPFGLFILFLAHDVGTGSIAFRHTQAIGFLILFALLFSPLSFFATRAGDVKTVVLLVLLLATGRVPMPSSLFREVVRPDICP